MARNIRKSPQVAASREGVKNRLRSKRLRHPFYLSLLIYQRFRIERQRKIHGVDIAALSSANPYPRRNPSTFHHFELSPRGKTFPGAGL